LNKNKYRFFGLILSIAHVCHGQFFYTDLQNSHKWLEANSGNFTFIADSTNRWKQYNDSKKLLFDKTHHFGLFLNVKNKSKLKSIFNRADLIGNGLITNYKFAISNIEIMNSMFFTYDSLEASRGFVRTIKNVTMYTNQSYLKIYNQIENFKYSVKIGRDFYRISHGINSALYASDYSRPFDQLSLSAEYGKITGNFSIIELDTLYDHKRYAYFHSFDYKSDRIHLTIGESIISTGERESINIKYLNPFHLWSWENLGSTNKGLNAFLYAGATWFPKPGLRLFSEVIIDDINFHTKDAFYLNRYGYLIGLQKTQVPIKSSNFWIEFSNVLNQVYQSFHPTHIYVHKGYPIGHYLGNDFINTRIHYSQIFKGGIVKSFIDLSYLIDGNNGLETPFDNPWENEKGELIEGYTPPSHPTSPNSKWVEIEVGSEIKIRDLTYITISVQYNQSTLPNNSPDFSIGLRFWSYFKLLNF
tara:strand:+ start:302 stop:1717 length:1416 start_codon:yes stop_codon:yes gene_type:complete